MSETAPSRNKKNIVLCCDGTGNEFGDCNSNVVKLYTVLKIHNEQIGYYHPGVGTMGSPGARNGLEKAWSKIKGLAFASGFMANVEDAYRYLMANYNDGPDGEAGDDIYIFGFSRGAYTARAVAAIVHAYGLLCPGNEGHIPYMMQMFYRDLKTAKDGKASSLTPQETFKETFSRKNVSLRFVGVWDTVSSVGWVSTPLKLLYSAQNPSMLCGRHAVSIDERRCFFTDNLWGPPLLPTDPGYLQPQDILQVWFPGVHSDIGGSYAQHESALANTTLYWLLGEAVKQGLQVDEDRVNMVFSLPTKKQYSAAVLYSPAPAPLWEIHRSLHGIWWLLELLPHRFYDKDDEGTKDEGAEKWRIPLGRPRTLPDQAIIHSSAVTRMQNPDAKYAPVNVPQNTLTPYAGEPVGTNNDLSGFYVYNKPGGIKQVPSPAGKAVGAVAAVALFGVLLLTRKLLRL